MTTAALREAIEAVLGAVAYEPPVSVAYTRAVYDALRERAPSAVCDVYHRYDDIVVELRHGASSYKLVVPLT